MRFQPGLQLIALLLLVYVPVVGFSQQQIFVPKKDPQSLFISVEDAKAYVYEVYRLPNGYGTSRRMLDELSKTGEGKFKGKVTELDIVSVPASIKMDALHEKKNFASDLVEKKDRTPYNRALNQALLSSTAYRIDSLAKLGYKRASFPSITLEKRFYKESEISNFYRQYDASHLSQLDKYADSVLSVFNTVHDTYKRTKDKTQNLEVNELVEDFRKLSLSSNYLEISPFSEMVNELANVNPAKFYEVARASKYENKIKMFNALTRQSRKYLLRNGPDCAESDELKDNYSKNSLKTGLMIGVPSALIIVGAIFLQTN